MLNLISETNKNMVLYIIKGNNSRTINFKIKLTCILLILMSEWLIVAYLTEHFSAISWREQVNFQSDDDEVRFVLARPTCCASSLKQKYADKHVTPLGHIILILSQPVFVLSL
jgi:hypothetical protein